MKKIFLVVGIIFMLTCIGTCTLADEIEPTLRISVNDFQRPNVGETFTLTIVIDDEKSGITIENASVTCNNETKLTDEKGQVEFLITQTTEGLFLGITATKDGYTSAIPVSIGLSPHYDIETEMLTACILYIVVPILIVVALILLYMFKIRKRKR